MLSLQNIFNTKSDKKDDKIIETSIDYIKISVKMWYDEEPMFVEVPSTASVADLKFTIAKEDGFTHEGHQLFLIGSDNEYPTPLHGHKQLNEYKLKRGDVVHVEKALKGGCGWCFDTCFVCFCVPVYPCPPRYPCCGDDEFYSS